MSLLASMAGQYPPAARHVAGHGWLVARLRHLASLDLRVDADVVERPGDDGHRNRARPRTVSRRTVEVVPLGGGDRTDDQPQNQQDGADTHCRSLLLSPDF